jgi:predicted amidophosphoribosyltransferase
MILRTILDAVFPPQCAACNALGSALCSSCAPPVTTFSVPHPSIYVIASGWYEGALRTAVLALKDGRRDVAEALGARLAPAIEPGSLLVPVPTTRARLRARGVDGVALVAETAAWLVRATVTRTLEHCSDDMQRGRSRHQRLAARDRFRARASLDGRVCTLVDDVCTTGATLSDCALAIGRAGGSVTGAVVVAATKSPALWP